MGYVVGWRSEVDVLPKQGVRNAKAAEQWQIEGAVQEKYQNSVPLKLSIVADRGGARERPCEYLMSDDRIRV